MNKIMQKKGVVIFGILIITLLSVSFVSASAFDQLCEVAGAGAGCGEIPIPPPPVAENDFNDVGTSNTQKIGGISFPFLSNLYKGTTYTNEELVGMGKAISERADVKEAISRAEESCKYTGGAKCDDWMTPAYCSYTQKGFAEQRLADCDYVTVMATAKDAYQTSLTPINPAGSIEKQRCEAGRAFDGSTCDSSPPDVVKESALDAAATEIEANAKNQKNKAPQESALAAAAAEIEANAKNQISKEFTPAEIGLGDIMLHVGGTSTVKELVDWEPISDRELAYAKMKLQQEQKMCIQFAGKYCEISKNDFSAVDKLTQAKTEQEKAKSKSGGTLIRVTDRFGKIVLQFILMVQNLFGNRMQGSSYTPAK